MQPDRRSRAQAGTRGPATRAGGIVLAGGRSSRMGVDKAHLDWHGAPLLVRVVDVLVEALRGRPGASVVPGPVVVVRRPGQELPSLPAGVAVVDDGVPGRGPLQALRDGLAAVAERGHDAAFVASVDAPWLDPAFVLRVLAGLEDAAVDAAVPVVRGRRQHLLAAYRTRLVADVDRLLDAGERAVGSLHDRAAVRLLDERWLLADPALAEADPALRSIDDVDTPDDYASALRARSS